MSLSLSQAGVVPDAFELITPTVSTDTEPSFRCAASVEERQTPTAFLDEGEFIIVNSTENRRALPPQRNSRNGSRQPSAHSTASSGALSTLDPTTPPCCHPALKLPSFSEAHTHLAEESSAAREDASKSLPCCGSL